ncbi:hypothetical protein Tco_0770052 [Tanacetum coccineum]|uniref:Uncharacterized protein n=1 Tax=Tanacetum coccineum TaxID=301880 RepID=A0ABQ4ZD02_9ASTR
MFVAAASSVKLISDPIVCDCDYTRDGDWGKQQDEVEQEVELLSPSSLLKSSASFNTLQNEYPETSQEKHHGNTSVQVDISVFEGKDGLIASVASQTRESAVKEGINTSITKTEKQVCWPFKAKSTAAEERERSVNERLSRTLSRINVLEAQELLQQAPEQDVPLPRAIHAPAALQKKPLIRSNLNHKLDSSTLPWTQKVSC